MQYIKYTKYNFRTPLSVSSSTHPSRSALRCVGGRNGGSVCGVACTLRFFSQPSQPSPASQFNPGRQPAATL